MKYLTDNCTLVLVLCALMSLPVTQSAAQAQAGTAVDAPSADNLMRHIYALADDSMMGRGTETPEYDTAARDVAETLRGYALVPDRRLGGSGLQRYYQYFGYESPGPLWEHGSLESHNVIGIVPGTDPELSSEHVVVGAHLDHLGVVDGEVMNGASDNASGVAVMLEVARLISRRPPSRTVVFVAFGAEEYGHLGSMVYVQEIPDDVQVVANININDVGHLGKGSGGRPLLGVLHEERICEDLFDMVRVHGDSAGIAITDRNRDDLFTHGDHYSFYQVDIPAIFFSPPREHEWRHTPQDDPEEMDGAQLQKVASVVYQTVRTVSENIDVCGSR